MKNKSAHKGLVKYFPHFLILVAGLVLGGILGYFGRKFLELTLKPEVSIDQLFNFIIGIIVAVILQSLWQKNYGTLRVEKDLYLEQLKKIQAKFDISFEQFHKIYLDEIKTDEDREPLELLNQFNLLVTEIETVKRIILNLKKNLVTINNKYVKIIDDLEMDIIIYKNTLTLKEYNERYDPRDFIKAQNSFNTINDKLFNLMIEVNSN